MSNELDELRATVKEMRDALRFYADPVNYMRSTIPGYSTQSNVDTDGGAKARNFVAPGG